MVAEEFKQEAPCAKKWKCQWMALKPQDHCILHDGNQDKALSEFTDAVHSVIKSCQKIDFDGVFFPDGFKWRERVWSKPVSFYYAVFRNIDFSHAVFEKDANFYDATFTEKASFSGAMFTEEVDFFRATFTEKVHFNRVTFTKQVHFSEAMFKKEANFFRVMFPKEANFSGATFKKEAGFYEATFTEKANFGEATFTEEANFFRVTFKKEANFSKATFTRLAYFVGVEFKSLAIFQGSPEEALFAGTVRVNFKHIIFTQPNLIRFAYVDFSRCDLSGTDVRKIDFSGVVWGERGRWLWRRKVLSTIEPEQDVRTELETVKTEGLVYTFHKMET